MSRTLVGVFALFLVFTLGGCEDSAGVGDSGSLSIFLTDDPGFLEAWVNIERIELVGGGEGEGAGIQVLGENFGDIDLLTLANQAMLLVDETTVEATTYSQLRFIIPKACIVLGEVVGDEDVPSAVYASPDYDLCNKAEINNGDLQLPSFDQTGIKVQLPNEELVVSAEQQALLVDFDVSESFGHEAGNSGKWVMHPVIRAEDMGLSRNIIVELSLGTLELSEPETLGSNFQAKLGLDGTPVEFTGPDGEGKFTATFLYVLPGQSYEVYVDQKETSTLQCALNPASYQTVNLTSDQDEIVSWVVDTPSTP